MRAIGVFLINAICPLLGLAVAVFGLRPDIASGGVMPALSSAATCAVQSLLGGSMDCAAPIGFGWLAAGSAGLLALVAANMVTNRVAAGVLGVSRSVLAIGFAPYVAGNLLGILIIGLANIAILAGILYLAASYWLAADATLLLIVLAASALSLIYVLARQGLAFFSTPKTFSPARPISLHEQPRLGLLIRDVARRTNARMPDNIVLGLEPTFFATNARVQTPYLKGPLKGETLHLSLPLLGVFSINELRAVIGHELGHFSGRDTAYSMRFAPALYSLHGAVQMVQARSRTITGFFLTPARLLLEDVAHIFGAVHGRISRTRETRADSLGAKAASPEDVAYSLLKASVGASVWRTTIDSLVTRARLGRFSRNIVRNFCDQFQYDIDRHKLPPSLQFAMEESVQHPTDAHPATEKRIEALGLSLSGLLEDDHVLRRFFASERANASLDNLAPIEEDLTTLYYHILQSDWAPHAPKEKDAEEVFLGLMADFLARMVTIDGSVDEREIEAAEKTAGRLFGNFDRDGFRERCRHPEDLPDLDRMVELANVMLTETGGRNLKTALRNVANADAELKPEEAALLAHIEATLNPANRDEDETPAS